MYSKSKITINNILEESRTLFIGKNYADVTIAEIAARADVSKGALYHHFSSKEDLYVRMMHYYLERIQSVTQDVAENSVGNCRERLRESAATFLRLPDDLLRVLRLVRRDINIFSDPLRNALIRAYQSAVPEQIEVILRDCIANNDIETMDSRLLSWEMVAIVETALRPYSRSVLGGPEEMADFCIALFFDGVAIHNRVTSVKD
jgi:AcrR family transcriptional regulator